MKPVVLKARLGKAWVGQLSHRTEGASADALRMTPPSVKETGHSNTSNNGRISACPSEDVALQSPIYAHAHEAGDKTIARACMANSRSCRPRAQSGSQPSSPRVSDACRVIRLVATTLSGLSHAC